LLAYSDQELEMMVFWPLKLNLEFALTIVLHRFESLMLILEIIKTESD
jgi:hypothetical protein